MGRVRGFLLKNRVCTLFRRIFRRRTLPAHRNPFSRLVSWTRAVKTKAKVILSGSPNPRYIRIGQDPEPGPEPVPKGYVAIRVGEGGADFRRVLVPVVHFNHPLFGDLLKLSEKEYGFNYPGGIIVPCPVSEFERVQRRIEAGWRRQRRRLLTPWRRNTSFRMC